ncbi:VWA domain-containing protein [Candidatus Chloroploca sp. Khr17]|uniref:VWA domain-containing protein n=1 Tax=Candidatus Chloroploca sp. Khr17 TaxID=2496869 RepID=UPI001F0F627C|nr:VWA domain-containing protein [Candidatus Chloroploca sp. Khr17]
MSVNIHILPPEMPLHPSTGVQVGYAIVTIAADTGGAAMPVNWAVVADASRSMRIPIVSEAQFRDLVRAGGAEEVLVDGVPVWQLTTPVPETIRASAPSALDHTVRALHSIVERLDQADQIALVACHEQALLLVATNGAERASLLAGASRLASLDPGETTDLAAGMRLALAQIGQHHDGVSRMMLLTDGFTRDGEACVTLAREAAARGISVSTLGLGGEFQDELLTRIADLSGGRAVYVRQANAIPAAVAAELEAARQVVARSLQLTLTHLPRGCALRYVTRLSPSLAPLEWEEDPVKRHLLIRLGDLERGRPVRLLLELVAPPAPPHPPTEGARVRLATLTAQSGNARVATNLIGHYAGRLQPPAILDAAGRASAVRLQRRAAAAIMTADYHGAAQLLHAAARRFADLGETDLAEACRHEATMLATTGQDTGANARALTYATRRLGEYEA